MSGIYIHGIDMPKTLGVPVTIYPDGRAIKYLGYGVKEQLGTAIHVPAHGRLIDADSKTFPTFHRKELNDYMKGWNACLRSVQQQPTIIPASKGETDERL